MEAVPHSADSLDARLDALAHAASLLPWPLSRERDEAVCFEMARLLDALLVRVARGRGAIDVALGEGLAALSTGDRVLRLGYAGIGDYSREVLGVAASTAQKMARLARELDGRARGRERRLDVRGAVSGRRRHQGPPRLLPGPRRPHRGAAASLKAAGGLGAGRFTAVLDSARTDLPGRRGAGALPAGAPLQKNWLIGESA